MRLRNRLSPSAPGNLDGFTLGVAVGVPRRGAHTRDVGIERIPGVHMQVSEERLAIAIEMRAGGSRFSSFEGETRRAHENPSERIDNQSVENHCVPPGVDYTPWFFRQSQCAFSNEVSLNLIGSRIYRIRTRKEIHPR